MTFTKYKSIPKTYDAITINYYREQGYADKVWYVTEKIHGANYSFIAKTEVQHAGRDGVLGRTESLFNSRAFAKDIEAKALALAMELSKEIQLVTEFYGKGIVNKSAIPYNTLNGLDKDFIAYDLLVDGEYMNYEEAIELFKKFEIPYMPILFKGTMDECMKFKIEKSMLCDSSPEGMVLKPLDAIHTVTGDRVILKDVYEQFQETHNKRAVVEHIKEKKLEMTKLDEHRESILNCLTDVRIDKLVARHGIAVNKEDMNQTIKALLPHLAKDIAEELPEVDFKLINQLSVPKIKTYINSL